MNNTTSNNHINFYNSHVTFLNKQNTNARKGITFFMGLISVIALLLVAFYEINTTSIIPLSALKDATNSFTLHTAINYLLLIVLIVYIVEWIINEIIYKSSYSHYRLGLGIGASIRQKYYQSIYSFSFINGAYSYEVDYYTTKKINTNVATGNALFKSVVNVLVGIVLFSIALTVMWTNYVQYNTIFFIFSIIALVTNALILLFMLLLTLPFDKINKLFLGLFKVMYFLGFVKDYRASFTNFMRYVLEYQKTIKFYNKKIFTVILLILLTVIKQLLYPMVFVVVFGAFSTVLVENIINLIVVYYVINTFAQFIKIPFDTILIELLFLIFASVVFATGTIFWSLLAYRIVFYYLPVLLYGVFNLSKKLIYKL